MMYERQFSHVVGLNRFYICLLLKFQSNFDLKADNIVYKIFQVNKNKKSIFSFS